MGGITYLQQISITIIYAFSAEVDHFRKEKLIYVTLLLWADAKKVGLRRLFRLNNVTGSFNPYGFQDDKFHRLLRRFAPRNDVCSFARGRLALLLAMTLSANDVASYFLLASSSSSFLLRLSCISQMFLRLLISAFCLATWSLRSSHLAA